jgi:hypothetical protein
MAALPIAMLSATVLGALGVGIAFSNSSSDTEDYILLVSGQRIRIETRVRLNEDGIKANPDSCLVGQEGRVTKLNRDTRTVTVQCKKGNKVEQHPADMLSVTDSGINAPGIDIAGGWAVEGSTVRLLPSAKRLYPGRGLASPFYKAVGTIVAINKTRKEVHVTSESLNSKTDTATWYYNAVDLELVGRPIVNRKRGIHNGEIQEGSTVRLKVGADGKILPDILAKYTKKFGLTSTAGVDQPEKTLFTQPSTKLANEKEWEKTGKVTSVIEDPKDPSKTWVRVLCVSKKSRGTVAEEQYDAADLEAVPATSIPRAGIPIFGGMAEEGVHVKVRVERRDAVASKPLGRPAFGEVGTVTRVDGEADDNLKVFVTCNGQNAEEQTGDWYEPEDLEVVDPDETEGEPVFGGRVVVGSMVRVMQSGRGKKCLGTMEVGDIGSVKGIDPNAADNLKINVTCGRSPAAKQSEWYDPRDLQVFFGVEDAGTPLAQARSALDIAERNLARQRRQPEYDAAEEARLLQDVANAKQSVDNLSKQTVDMTKVKEVYENAQEKLQSAQKLKRDIESLRLTASKQTTCDADPGRAARFTQKFNQIEAFYIATRDNRVLDPNAENWNELLGTSMKPVQYSDRFKTAWQDLYRARQRLPAADQANDPLPAYKARLRLELELRINLVRTNRDSPEEFDNLGDVLRRLSNARTAYDAIPVTPLKSSLNDIDEKLQKLKDITRDIETAAYSGNTPTERLLARINNLIAENNAKQDIIEGPAPARGAGELGPLTRAYNNAFDAEQQAKFQFDEAKQNYERLYVFAATRKELKKPASQALWNFKEATMRLRDAEATLANAQADRQRRFQLAFDTTRNEADRLRLQLTDDRVRQYLSNAAGIAAIFMTPGFQDIGRHVQNYRDTDVDRRPTLINPGVISPVTVAQNEVDRIEQDIRWHEAKNAHELDIPREAPETTVQDLTTATRNYLDAKKATLRARKAEQIKSGELTCLLQSTEAAMDLQAKIRKIVDGKCKVLADADAVNAQIDNLIDVRKRAFLMAQASRDPSFGRGDNAGRFSVPVGTNFAERIQLMNEALARVTADPTIAGLNQLIELCGTYDRDGLLGEAREVASRTYRGGADSRAPGMQRLKRNTQTFRTELVKQAQARRAEEAKRAANAPLPEYNRVNPAFYTAPVGSEMAPEDVRARDLKGYYSRPTRNLLRQSATEPTVDETWYSSPTGREMSPEEQAQEYLEMQRIDEMNAIAQDKAIERRRMVEQGFEMSPEEQASEDLARRNIDYTNTRSAKLADERERMAEQGFESEDEYDRRYREAQKGVEAPLRDTAQDFKKKYERNKFYEGVEKSIADADKVIEEQRKEEDAEAKREQDKYDFDLQRQRALFAARASNLSADLRKKAEKAQEDAILQEGGPELLAAWKKDKKTQERLRIQRAKQAEIEERQRLADQNVALREQEQLKAQMAKAARIQAIKDDNNKLTRDILDVSERLANDQILRLKMLVVSNSTAVDLAQQLTIQGDRLEQEIRDSRSEFQFNIAQRGGANGDDFKIQNDVDYYKEELEKSKMCIMDFKKKAIDQYNLDLAKLDQQKEEIKAKAFEVKEAQEGKKSKDLSTWSVDDLNKEIKRIEQQITGLKNKNQSTTSSDTYLQRLKDALKNKKTGGTRRVTIRQPPRPKHRVY